MADLTHIFMTLPKPTGLSFNYPKEWGQDETGVAGALADGNYKGALGTGLLKLLAGVAGDPAASAAQAKTGQFINKRNVAMFRDLPFRQVTFDWVLMPRSSLKAREFMDIIDMLKYESAPKLLKNGTLWSVDGTTWSLQIKADTAGRTIFYAEQLVITNIIVNYTPNGFWSQHKDGYPTQINLTLELMELELLHRDVLRGPGVSSSGGYLV